MRYALRIAPVLVCLVGKVASAQEATPESPAPAGTPAPAAGPEGAPAGEAPAASVKDQAALKTEKKDDAPGAHPEPPPAADGPKPEDHESGEDDSYGHMMQVGLRTGIVFGYKIDFRYPHSPLCREFDESKESNEQQKICGYGAPPAATTSASSTRRATTSSPSAGKEP